jgi:hypothetical protein
MAVVGCPLHAGVEVGGGHSAFTLTLDVYGDFIPEQDGGAVNPLPEPTAAAKPAEPMDNVVNLLAEWRECLIRCAHATEVGIW